MAAGRMLDEQGEAAGAASVAVATGLLNGGDEASGEAVGSFRHGFFVPEEGCWFLQLPNGYHKNGGNEWVVVAPGWNIVAL